MPSLWVLSSNEKEVIVKKLLTLVFLLGMLSSCTERTKFGECVGMFEEEKRKPDLIYKADTGNLIVAVIFWEMIFPPVFVALDQTYCPVGVKD